MKKILALILAALMTMTLAMADSPVDALDAFEALTGTPIRSALTNEVLDQVMNGLYSKTAETEEEMVGYANAMERLALVTTDEINRYAEEKQLDSRQVRNFYYIALANTLRAEIALNPATETRYQNIQVILNLFLEGTTGDTVVEETRKIIRSSMTRSNTETIAQEYALPADFVSFLIMNDKWDNDDWTDDDDWKEVGGFDDSIDDTLDDSMDDSIDDSIDNTMDDTLDNSIDDTLDDTPDASIDDSIDNTPDASIDNTVDNTPDASIDNTVDNTPDASIDNTPDASIDSTVDNTPDASFDDTADDSADDTPDNT